MDDPKKSRKLARCWLTRATSTLQKAVESENTTLAQLQSMVENFHQRCSTLDEAQRALELTLEEDELDAHVEEAEAYIAEKNAVLYKALDKMESMSGRSRIDSDNASIHSGGDGGGAHAHEGPIWLHSAPQSPQQSSWLQSSSLQS